MRVRWSLLALTLLVAQVLANDHDPTVTTNDLALVADRLDARLDLHGPAFLVVALLVAVNDSAAGEVVGRELHHYPILRKDPDVVLPHLAADVREHLVSVAQFHSEHRVRQWLDHFAFDLDGPVFFGHILRFSLYFAVFHGSPARLPKQRARADVDRLVAASPARVCTPPARGHSGHGRRAADASS